jgi:GNAT superfamily N-acetyltransferase
MAAMIRAVAPRDASAWASMRSCLWPDADPAELAREASAFLDGVPSATVHAVFVASEDVPPVGFIELAVRAFSEGCMSSPVPHVEGWYVQPSARGRGIGRRLIEAAEACRAPSGSPNSRPIPKFTTRRPSARTKRADSPKSNGSSNFASRWPKNGVQYILNSRLRYAMFGS